MRNHRSHTHAPGLSRRWLLLGLAVGAASLCGQMALAQEGKNTAPVLHLPAPKENDRCPVCGMFVARYHEWVATMVFKDGHVAHFDGAKDAFKFWLDMKKYDQHGHTQAEVKDFGVTAYYSVEMIDARKAFYVIGSDVTGPMGHELIPHPDMYDAKAFMKDHRGKAIVRFEDIDMAMLKGLDDGRFIVHGKELK